MHFLVFSSSFCSVLDGIKAKAKQPNTLRWFTEGFSPHHASYGVVLCKADVGGMLMSYTTVAMASAQKSIGKLLLLSILWAISTIFLFFLSTTLFYQGVQGAVRSLLMPTLSQQDEKSCEVNSPPMSIRRALILSLVYLSTVAWNFRKMMKVSDYCLMKYTQHLRVQSSIKRAKNLLPSRELDCIGQHKSALMS